MRFLQVVPYELLLLFPVEYVRGLLGEFLIAEVGVVFEREPL